MKRQSLLQVVIFAGMALVMLVIVAMFRLHTHRALAPGAQREARLGSLSLQVPAAFGEGRAYRDGAWEVREFRGGGLGTLRLATEPGNGTPWETLCTTWFGLRTYHRGPVRYEAFGHDWFLKEVPLFGRGVYALRKHGKQVRFIAFFEREGVRHWIGLDTRDSFSTQKIVFDHLVASLRTVEGAGPGAELRTALRPIMQEGGYRFIQPPEVILAIPALAILVVTLVQWGVRRRAGRLPEAMRSRSVPAAFMEAGIEIGLLRPWQRKFLDGAAVVDDHGITIHTFGTPFMTLPRGSWTQPIGAGTAWLGLPYLQLELVAPPRFHKWERFYRAMRVPLSIRIYTREVDRLRAALR